MIYFSFSPDHSANSFHFLRGLIAQLHDVVESVCYLSRFSGPFAREAHREVALLESNQGLQQQLCI
jgi:hypothetical protein